MFKVTILFLSMFFLFGCNEDKASSSPVNEQLEEKKRLESQIKEVTDKTICEELLAKLTSTSKALEAGESGLNVTPPTGECTDTGYQEKTE